MSIVILRRPKWARDAMKNVSALSEGVITAHLTNHLDTLPEASSYLRWGWTGAFQPPAGAKVLNPARSISQTASKGTFAKTLSDVGAGLPTFLSTGEWAKELMMDGIGNQKFILRPCQHARGEDLHLLSRENVADAFDLAARYGDIYIRPYVKKAKEFRVYVVCGRVYQIEQKTVDNPDQVAWGNEGADFRNVRWGLWDDKVCDVSVKAFQATGLHFAALDVIVDEAGDAYVLEVNTAPELYCRNDGGPTYMQEIFVETLMWHDEAADWETIPTIPEEKGWRAYIHPAMSKEAKIA